MAQPVEQAPLISGSPLIVAGDGAQFGGQLAMGDQRAQGGVPVQGEQAADTGIFSVVLLARGAAAAGDQVRVDRQDHIAGVQQAFHEQPVAGLDHHPDLGRLRFQGRDLGDELVDGCRRVLHPQDLYHPLVGVSQGDEVEGLGPVDPNPKHHGSFPGSPTGGGAAPC